MSVIVYSDASYCHKSKIAACGYLVIYKEKIINHSVELLSGLSDIGVAESYALAKGLQFCFLLDVKCIEAFTDRYSLVQLKQASSVRPSTRKRHKEYFETIEMITDYGIEVKISYVKGHSGNIYNTRVDKSCNKNLKKYLQSDNDLSNGYKK